jgi:hypothetical protein
LTSELVAEGLKLLNSGRLLMVGHPKMVGGRLVTVVRNLKGNNNLGDLESRRRSLMCKAKTSRGLSLV